MSLREELKDQFKNMIKNPKGDIANTRNRARRDLQTSLEMDVR
jgi:F0F1-type ATP synthase membrane subunit b/b'